MPTQKRVSLAITLAVSLLAGCSSEPTPVSYQKGVKPLIDKYCSECHLKEGEGAAASGFLTESYETVMKGTKYGPVIVPGDALSSSLYRLVSGKVHSSIRMPHGRDPLTEQEIATIEQWISQGASGR